MDPVIPTPGNEPSRWLFAEGKGSSRRGAWVLLCAFVVYATTLRHELVWDDLILLNMIREAGFPALLRLEFLKPGSGYYRPLVLASLWLDDTGSRLLPSLFHLTNVLLHAANSYLVWRLLRRLFPAAALWGALLFAVHPAAAEAVSFVSGRTDLWAALFVLLLTLRWVALMQDPGRRGWRDWLPWFGLFLLGGLAKETVFMLPPVLLAWGWLLFPAPAGGVLGRLRRDGFWLGAAAAGIAALLVLRIAVAGVGFGQGVAGLGSQGQVAAVNRLSLIPAIFGTYARLLVWPWPLLSYYTQAMVRSGPGTIAAAVALVLAAALTSGRKSSRAGAVGLAWIAGFLLPVSGLVRIGGAPVAERFLYLPLLGLAVIFARSVAGLATAGRGRWAAPLGAGLVLLVLATLTAQRTAVWKDEITLFERTLRDAGDSFDSLDALVVKTELGEAYRKAGRRADAQRVQGDVAVALGMFPQAVEAYLQAGAPPGAGERVDHRRLGAAYLGAQRLAEAATELGAAVRDNPGDTKSRDRLGQALQQSGDAAGAEAAFRAALQADPGFLQAQLHLGALLVAAGRPAEAIPLLERFVAAEPGSATGQNNLGAALYRLQRFSAAARALERARQLEPGDPLARFNLALAYRAAGDAAAAAREQRSLVGIDAGLAAELARMLR